MVRYSKIFVLYWEYHINEKSKENEEAIYQYRCRFCKKEYTHMVGGWNNNSIINDMITSISTSIHSQHVPDLLDIHCCNHKQFGIADFIGVKKRIS